MLVNDPVRKQSEINIIDKTLDRLLIEFTNVVMYIDWFVYYEWHSTNT